MTDLLTAIGLMFVVEGAMYALFPRGMKELTARMAVTPDQQLRTIGILFAVFGFVIVAVLRGY